MALPGVPTGVTLEEWRRAVALMAAVETQSEGITSSPVMRENNALATAKRFETYLRDGK